MPRLDSDVRSQMRSQTKAESEGRHRIVTGRGPFSQPTPSTFSGHDAWKTRMAAMMRPRDKDRSPFDITDLSNKREIGAQPGTLWSLSSQKPGYGVRQLRDPDLERLWQSDGTQPHRIKIEFAKRTAVTHISLWLNVRRDDSYTPTKILVEAGTDYHDLTEVRYREWEMEGEPFQWKHFYLSSPDPRSTLSEEGEDDDDEDDEDKGENGRTLRGSKPSIVRPTYSEPLVPIHTWVIQISVLANHQNGKDTHVRGCLVWGPRDNQAGPSILANSFPLAARCGVFGRVDSSDNDGEDDEDDTAQSGRPSQLLQAWASSLAARDQRLLRTLR